jgi:hypothetical protein
MLKSDNLICKKTSAMVERQIYSTLQLRDFEVKSEGFLK